MPIAVALPFVHEVQRAPETPVEAEIEGVPFSAGARSRFTGGPGPLVARTHRSEQESVVLL